MTAPQENSSSYQYWDSEAESFDDQPDHGLKNPIVLNAWTQLIADLLPLKRANILDVGCGTGSLSTILAGLGHNVTGIDFSPTMISKAQNKAALHGFSINFHVMIAADPTFPAQSFDALLCRHLLWSLTYINRVLESWSVLLKPGGRFLLIEGHWDTAAGLHSEQIIAALPSAFTNPVVRDLSHQSELWGRDVEDERYAITADLLI